METAFFTLLLTAGAYAYLRELQSEESGYATAFLFSLAALTRPEALAFYALTALHRAAYSMLRGRFVLTQQIRYSLPFALIIGAHFVFRYAYYGALLPNTFYAKTGWETDYLKHGLSYAHRFVEGYGLSLPPWGVTSAPLVDGDRVIAIVGGEPDALVVAFDKETGPERWRALDVVAEAGYGQPVIYEAGGARQLIVWHPTGLASLDPVTGGMYWEQAFDTTNGMTIATPVKSDRYLLITQLYHGALMMRLGADRPTAELLWKGSSNSYEPDETDGLHAMTTTPMQNF